MTAEESSDEKMPPNEAEIAASTAASKMDPETEPLNAGAGDNAKVKFIGGSETVDVEKGGVKSGAEVKGALTKAELMKYATDKKWVSARWALFILFWICWLAMLVASVVIIIQAPKCPSPEPKQWWQKAPVYEVFVKSFKDSNGDGIGDLKGVESKVDYLKGLGVGSVWLSSIFKSPMTDVSDHKEVDSAFGTMEEFESLVAKLHENGMKVILDFIPNYSSKLNLKDVAVVKELTDILEFWIGKGVDGFRVEAENENFGVGDGQLNSDEVLELLKKFREVLNEASKDNPTDPKIMMTDLASSELAPYYGNIADQIGDISHMPLNLNLLSDFKTPSDFSAEKLKTSIENYMEALPNDAWPNFCIGRHDSQRAASRFGSEKAGALNMILMLLQGTPFTYYGEEIGMTMVGGPMQWNAEANAGFSSAAPWKAVGSDYQDVNVAKAEETEDSILKVYREMTNLREDEAILFGDTNLFVQDNTFVLSRVKKGNPGYLLISNFGDSQSTLNLQELPNIAERGILSVSSPKSEMGIGSNIDLANVAVPQGVTFLVTFVPKFK